MSTNFDFSARVEFNSQIRRVESAPLTERQEARADWQEALKDPALVCERIEWLLDGNYGYGSYEEATTTIHNKRMNRPAWLGQVIAALEWQCPNNFARQAWNKLTTDEQENITAMINKVIEKYLQAEDMEEQVALANEVISEIIAEENTIK